MRKYLGKKIKPSDAIENELNPLHDFCNSIPTYLGIDTKLIKEIEITASKEDPTQLHTLRIKFKDHPDSNQNKDKLQWVKNGEQDWEFWISDN